MPVLGTVRSSAALAALLVAVGVALLALAGPAAAKTQRLKTGIYGDKNAKLTIVLQKTKKGKPQRVKSLKATKYDLRCKPVLGSTVEKVVEVNFSFPSMKIEKRKGKYGYAFSGQADDDDKFSDGYFKHAGDAEGYFSTSKKGKPKKLVGYLAMGAFSNTVPGITGPAVCGDPLRKNPFQKLHGSFSTGLG